MKAKTKRMLAVMLAVVMMLPSMPYGDGSLVAHASNVSGSPETGQPSQDEGVIDEAKTLEDAPSQGDEALDDGNEPGGGSANDEQNPGDGSSDDEQNPDDGSSDDEQSPGSGNADEDNLPGGGVKSWG